VEGVRDAHRPVDVEQDRLQRSHSADCTATHTDGNGMLVAGRKQSNFELNLEKVC
jgi:hypothetical protein